jgi:hypothetical protein
MSDEFKLCIICIFISAVAGFSSADPFVQIMAGAGCLLGLLNMILLSLEEE